MDKISRNLNILIIDDEADAREALKSFLERRGYLVFTAENGRDGLVKAKDNPVDIIYCDIVMPEMDGIKFLEHLREFNLKAEVIMMTASSTVERCVSAIEKNACAYLIKPLKTTDILANLLKAARRVEEKREMLKAAFSEKDLKRSLAYKLSH